MRRAALLLALATAAALAAGCGGRPQADEPLATVRVDPGGVLRRFVAAAAANDADRMWALLSARSRRQLGPDVIGFRAHGAARLGRVPRTIGRSGRPRIVLSETLNDGIAVAAVASGTHAYAAALRREDGRWLVELDRRIRLRPIAPDPGEVVDVPTPQIAAEVRAEAPIEEGGIWLDGIAFGTESGGINDRYLTIFGRSGRALFKGGHVAVAFARSGDEVGAVAWIFSRLEQI